MRLLLLIAIVFFVLALICLLVPTVVAGEGWQVWLVSGLLFWAFDNLLGGYVVPFATRRRQPPTS